MTGTSFHTNDVDEAEAITSAVYFENRIAPARNSLHPFHFGMNYGTAGPITFGSWAFGCEVAVHADGPDVTYTIGVPLAGTIRCRLAKDDISADPFTAAVASPHGRVSYRGFHTGTERLFALFFDRESLEDRLRALLGRDRISTITLASSLNLRTGLGAQWWRLASTLALDLQSPSGLMANPLIAPQLVGSIMTGLLLATDHPYREELEGGTRAVPPLAIREAAEIIESRAHEPLTVAGIAEEVGYSIRALQAGYRKHLNTTPGEHLRRIRLERAHAMLRLANPATVTVGDIATRWGFHQPGYFAAEYRKVYGVSPRITLRED